MTFLGLVLWSVVVSCNVWATHKAVLAVIDRASTPAPPSAGAPATEPEPGPTLVA